MKVKELSVFFPAYNEEVALKETVEKANEVLKKIAEEYEITIVNDGSKDKTGEIADQLAKKDKRVRVIHHPKNRGYGAALKSGLHHAQYPWIVFTDADGQFDFKEVYKFFEVQEKTGADLVIGYYLKRRVSLFRILASKYLWELPVFLLFRLRVRDIDCGFKLIRKEVIEKIPKLEAERGPFITTELLVKAKKSGFKIAEVGVHHYPRQAGQATGASLKVIISGFSDLIRLRRKLK